MATTSIHTAIEFGDEEFIEQFVAKVTHIDGEESGRTPLMSAALKGRADLVRRFLALGADPNRTDSSGATALHYAMTNPSIEVVTALLEAGADPNVQETAHGKTPLWDAVFRARRLPDVVAAMMKHGGDPNIANRAGVTPLGLADGFASHLLPILRGDSV